MKRLFKRIRKWWNDGWEMSIITQEEMNEFIDELCNQIYYEDSNGKIIDNRSKTVELTLDQIADKFGINVNQLKIKK